MRYSLKTVCKSPQSFAVLGFITFVVAITPPAVLVAARFHRITFFTVSCIASLDEILYGPRYAFDRAYIAYLAPYFRFPPAFFLKLHLLNELIAQFVEFAAKL